MQKCVHCRTELTDITVDHVFPDRWFPDSTPLNIQRWTVPSCKKCNSDFGALEERLRAYIIPSIEEGKKEISGLREKVYRSFGIDLKDNLETEELDKRRNLAKKTYNQLKPVSSVATFYPGFGPTERYSLEKQHAIEIPDDLLTKIFEKIVRGAEYVLNEKRIVEPPFEVSVFIGEDILKFEVLKIDFNKTENLGPGFRIQRLAGNESVLYKIVIWGRLVGYGSIGLSE